MTLVYFSPKDAYWTLHGYAYVGSHTYTTLRAGMSSCRMTFTAAKELLGMATVKGPHISHSIPSVLGRVRLVAIRATPTRCRDQKRIDWIDQESHLRVCVTAKQSTH
jgi:hypothetical protein